MPEKEKQRPCLKKEMLESNHYKAVNVKIFDDFEKYIKRLDSLKNQENEQKEGKNVLALLLSLSI